jgi:hypothetical protein
MQSMLKRKPGDVWRKINSLCRLESELAKAFRNCNRRTAPQLGNFPQALTNHALISAATLIVNCPEEPEAWR